MTLPQLDHALLDWEVFAKPKMKSMRRKFGELSRLWFVDCVLDMSRATDSAIQREDVTEMAREIGVSDPEALVQHALDEAIFFLDENGKVASARVIEDKSALALKRSKDRTRKRQQRDRERDASVTPDTEDLKNKKEEESETVRLHLTANLPATTMAACLRWAEYSHKRLRKPFGQIELDALLMSYGNRYAELEQNINASIAGGWRNIRPSGHATVTPLSQQVARPSSVKRGRETAAKLAEHERNKCDKPVDEILNEDQKSTLAKLKGVK